MDLRFRGNAQIGRLATDARFRIAPETTSAIAAKFLACGFA